MYKNYTQTKGVRYKHVHKILLIMRLTTIILLASLLQASATSFAQKISLSEKRIPLNKLFIKISQQSGYGFLVSNNMLKGTSPVSIEVNGAELDEVLKAIFKNQPVTYRLENKQVTVIRREEPSFIEKIISRFQAIEVRGKVVDSLGNPLRGANVTVKGGGGSVSTNENGTFYLPNVKEGATLVVSYVGYISREIKAASDIVVVLHQIPSKLDEVQVIAYGTTSKRLNPGSVGTVTAATIEKQPVANPLAALIGRVPGLDIVQQSGIPGGGFTVRVRGANSLNNSNEPLFLIDGVPFLSNSMTVGNRAASTITQAGGSSPFNVLNPNDIESISVLKDADATAIYGSRGANGVILITTKKGKAGDSQISVNYSSGIVRAGRMQEVLNRRQYLDMRYEAFKNEGLDWKAPANATNASDLRTLDTLRDNNFQDELLGNTGHINNLQANISGGNKNTRFSVGTAYYRETTIFPGDQSDKKISGRFSIDHNSDNEKFIAQFSGTYGLENNNAVSGDLKTKAVTMAPIETLWTPDGKLNWETGSNAIAAILYAPYVGKSFNTQFNGTLGYRIIKGMLFKTTAQYSRFQFNSTNLRTEASQWPAQFAFSGPNARASDFGKRSTTTLNIEPQLTYERNLGPGRLTALLGATFQETEQEGNVLYATGYLDDALMQDPQSATTFTTSSEYSEYKYNAIFGRLNYDINKRYILSLNGRRDGSSRFGSGNVFANFGSAAAAWIFSEEALIKNNLSFLSFGKLRVSHGVTGSDRIGDYGYMGLYRSLPSSQYKGPLTALVPNSLANEDYKWETNQKTDIGLSLGFFKDRILLDATYYRNRSSNQLVGLPLSSITGFTSVTANLPATVQNTGLELELNTVNIKGNAFRWSSSFNITLPKNKLVSYPNLESSPYANSYVVGKSISIVKVYPFGGVDPQTGLNVFYNRFGEKTSDKRTLIQADRTVYIDLSPKFYGGFVNNFSYKNFELEVFFQFANKTGLQPSFQALAGTRLNNIPLYLFERRWQKPGDITDIQRFSSGSLLANNARSTSDDEKGYQEVSYARLKNVSLYYSFPTPSAKRIGLSNLRVYLQAQNLLTITDYEGMDPENFSSGTGPVRVMTAGIQVNL
ncbi:SusC/RagA family TonB-linked outer membrane protein [Pedobacter miscanthi]|uniref:SusC/RagA family TonB-linked outer membrane protein n=1 Tax=Pedobacter miscanthi TaxID=2259170 RepID=UPI002930A45A|nr:SusC/RagA family TonB-linked outer membrane protein [Pedobacter miscanthi]